MGERLVRVERFEELATGMRVVARPCRWCGASRHMTILGARTTESSVDPDGSHTPVISGFESVGIACGTSNRRRRVTEWSIASGIIYRFASDLGIADQLAREENPYLSRTVVGTAGVDETRTLAKERGRG